jgi:hypothetical protein
LLRVICSGGGRQSGCSMEDADSMVDLSGPKAAKSETLGRLGQERNPSSVTRTPWLLGEKQVQRGKHRTEVTEVTEGGFGLMPIEILSVKRR